MTRAAFFRLASLSAALGVLWSGFPLRAQPLKEAPPGEDGAPLPEGFHPAGEHWTYREGDFVMRGILLKPEGKGPFPAVLISHGLGGNAEGFGMNKARAFVKWGLVCIAPDYTHNAQALGGRRPGSGGVAKPAADYATYGASPENLRRARKCLELAAALPEVDAKRLAAYGHSMGGFVTIGLAAQEPGLLKAAVITAGGIAPEEGHPAPSYAAADRIRTPFLIFHGGADTTVRPFQSAALKEILDRNHVPNERHVFEGENHPIDRTRQEDVYTGMREWFARQGVLPP
jgi:dienelactone hydrolase